MTGSNNANKEIFRSEDILNNAEELDARHLFSPLDYKIQLIWQTLSFGLVAPSTIAAPKLYTKTALLK